MTVITIASHILMRFLEDESWLLKKGERASSEVLDSSFTHFLPLSRSSFYIDCAEYACLFKRIFIIHIRSIRKHISTHILFFLFSLVRIHLHAQATVTNRAGSSDSKLVPLWLSLAYCRHHHWLSPFCSLWEKMDVSKSKTFRCSSTHGYLQCSRDSR